VWTAVFLLVGSLGALITVLFLAPLSQAAIVLRRFALRYFLCIPQAKTFSVEDAYHDPRAATPTKVTAKYMMWSSPTARFLEPVCSLSAQVNAVW